MQTQNWISFSMYQEKWHCWLYWLHCFRWLCYWSPWQSIFTNCSENNTYSCPNCVASTHSHFMPIEIEQTSEEVKGLWNSHTVLLVHLEWGGTHVSINFPYQFLCLLLNAFQNILDSHIVHVLVNCLTEWVPIGPTCLSKGSVNLLLWQQVQTTLLDNCLCNSASHLNMYLYDQMNESAARAVH